MCCVIVIVHTVTEVSLHDGQPTKDRVRVNMHQEVVDIGEELRILQDVMEIL